MTTYNTFSERNRDNQDGIERHVWGKKEYVKGAGSILKVKGTGTEDQEVVVVNVGYSFNVPENYNTEVLALSDGSDTNQKYGFPNLPRDKQREWKENTGGVQNPLDPDKALEFNPKRAHIREGNVALGVGGIVEVDGDTVYIRGNLVISGDLSIGGNLNVKGNIFSSGEGRFDGDLSTRKLHSPDGDSSNRSANVNVNVPGFEDY